MSKILVIPDVHLKPVIFDRAEKILESGQADFAIQLGDMVDDWGEEFNFKLYENTINKAIEFNKKFPKTLWCMGNHDFGYYLPEYGRRETGHSKMMEESMADLIAKMNGAGIEQKVIHVVDSAIFSHAGLTSDFVATLTLDGTDYEMGDYIEVLVNGAEPDLLWGDNSPIWARPQRTGEIMFSDKMQVVGHTPMEEISFVDNVLSTDVFSTYNNGAPIGERKFAIVDTEKQIWQYAKEEDE